MEFNWKGIGWILLVSVALIVLVAMVVPAEAISNIVTVDPYATVTTENSCVLPTPTPTPTPEPTPFVEDSGPSPTVKPTYNTLSGSIVTWYIENNEPVEGYGVPPEEIPYIHQGDTVYLNSTIDISGAVAPYPMLAYWNGYDMYKTNATYIINLPDSKRGWYHFYIDPRVFASRTGRWYKFDGEYEDRGWNLAFVVSPISRQNSTLTHPNGTIVNITKVSTPEYNQTSVPVQNPVEPRHVADYLVARGDDFNITVNQDTKAWLFGRVDSVLDYASDEYHLKIPHDVLENMEPGSYTLVLQTIEPGNADFTVGYDKATQTLKWYDPTEFKINEQKLAISGPLVALEQFKAIVPKTHDAFAFYTFELQDPIVDIISIGEKVAPNETVDDAGIVHYNTNVSSVRVLGYTNVAPGTPLTFVLDEETQTPRTLPLVTTKTATKGEYGGDMRWFDATIAVNKYNLAAGQHFVNGYSALSTAPATVGFFIFDAPAHSYIPEVTLRYIAGNEFVPTPTPIVNTVEVIRTERVVETVRVNVTPSDEQVYEQQKGIAFEIAGLAVQAVVVVAVTIGLAWYVVSVVRRKRENDKAV